MKRTLLIIFSYTLLVLAVCFGASAVAGHIPTLLPEHKSLFTLCRGLMWFFRIMPAVLAGGFLVGLAVQFSEDSEKAQMRFSPTIMGHFKGVMIISIILVCLMTLVSEVLNPLVQKKKAYVQEAPHLLSEYVDLGKQCLAEENYVLAHRYGTQILKIQSNNIDGQNLIDKSEAVLKAIKKVTPEERQTFSVAETLPFREIKNETVQELIEKSKKAAEKNKWFESHYYAQLAVTAGTSKDINLKEAKRLAAVAWNMVNLAPVEAKTTDQELFAKKRAAYKALSKGDNVDAYYQFLEIAAQDETWSSDPDVKEFLEISRQRVEAQCFFIDETEKLQVFETNLNVYFTIKHDSGVTDVVYIRGITPVTDGGKLVQYLRGLTVVTYGKNGSFIKSMSVPYAKMLSVDVSSFDEETCERMEIKKEYKKVPFIMLESIDRYMRGPKIEPEYEYTSYVKPEQQRKENFQVLAMSVNDFNTACEASLGNAGMSLGTLMKEAGKASYFGFCSEVANANLIKRITTPILMMVILVFLAILGWDYRVNQEQLFKFVWIIAIPVFSVVIDVLIQIVMTLAEIGTFALVAVSGSAALLIAVVICMVLLFVTALHFTLKKTN